MSPPDFSYPLKIIGDDARRFNAKFSIIRFIQYVKWFYNYPAGTFPIVGIIFLSVMLSSDILLSFDGLKLDFIVN